MHKQGGLLLIGVAVCLAIVASGGFSTTETERGLTIETVDDESAYVGYDSPDELSINTTEEEQIEEDLVTITNRFHTAIAIDAVEVEGAEIDVDYASRDIASGESETITLSDCEETDTLETVAITVEVSGSGISAILFGDTETREIGIDCHS